jgi:hypothetical protein
MNYKKMYEVSVQQSKALKLTVERKKDEFEHINNALRDIQSMSMDK